MQIEKRTEEKQMKKEINNSTIKAWTKRKIDNNSINHLNHLLGVQRKIKKKKLVLLHFTLSQYCVYLLCVCVSLSIYIYRNMLS